MSKQNGVMPLVITTSHKGVFFGYGHPTNESIIRIEKARMCIYWTSEVKGVLGLASEGPNKSCRIGPPVPAITLRDVTSIMECSDKAAAAWEKEPWS